MNFEQNLVAEATFFAFLSIKKMSFDFFLPHTYYNINLLYQRSKTNVLIAPYHNFSINENHQVLRKINFWKSIFSSKNPHLAKTTCHFEKNFRPRMRDN